MKKLLAALVFLVACGCGSPQKYDAPPPNPVVDNSLSMEIVVTGPMGNVWMGTGHVVDSETILTAGHVLDGADKVKLVFPNSLTVNVTELPRMVSTELDLGAINYLSETPQVTVGKVRVGDPVCYYPAVPDRGQKCGKVLGVDEGKNGLRITNDVVPGNSGSALFNEKDELVGVITAYNPLLGGGYATPISF